MQFYRFFSYLLNYILIYTYWLDLVYRLEDFLPFTIPVYVLNNLLYINPSLCC